MKYILILIFLKSILLFSQVWHPVGLPSDVIYDTGVPVAKPINGNLYVGCGPKIGTLIVNGIAMWNGSNWSNFNNGETLQHGGINSITIFQDKLYVGGSIKQMDYINTSNIASWNGTTWAALPFIPQNFFGWVRALQVYKNQLYFAGDFYQIGSTIVNRIARTNGATFSTVGGGVTGDITEIHCMTIYNNKLIVGGAFNHAGTKTAFYIAAWDSTHWSALDTGLSSDVNALCVDTINNFLYTGGGLTIAGGPGGVNVGGVARWDGEKWDAVGNVNLGYFGLYSLTMYQGYLIAGGGFEIKNANDTISGLAIWNGIDWKPLSKGTSYLGQVGTVFTLSVYKNELFVGGTFSKIGNDSVLCLARTWFPFDSTCNWLQPRVFSNTDKTFIINGQAQVQFTNNNAYAHIWQWSFGDTVQNPVHTFTPSDTGIVTVQITVTQDGCTKTATRDIVVMNSTNIEKIAELDKYKIKVYPNPASNRVHIEINTQNPITGTLFISDIKGNQKEVFEISENKKSISINPIFPTCKITPFVNSL